MKAERIAELRELGDKYGFLNFDMALELLNEVERLQGVIKRLLACPTCGLTRDDCECSIMRLEEEETKDE